MIEKEKNVEDGEDRSSQLLSMLAVVIFIVLTAASLYLIYSKHYTEIVAVLFVSWFLWVVIAEIPDDKKIIKMMLEPLKLLLTLLACSTLLAVVLVGLYLLYSLVVHLSSRLVELVKDSMRILGL